ncbi:phosphatase PAP2 family protein [Photobacterium kagoshimensis]|uniref:phosphatase PAP2 family protein n=1 Tax=Photobacterium kagoshimensis TaxID=2910242 RepID=UPI003D0A93B9
MLRTHLKRKLPSYKVLGLFALLLLAVLAVFPSPSLIAPASDSTGLLFTLLSNSAGNPWFLLAVALLCLLPLIYKKDKKACLTLWCQFAFILILSFAAKSIMKHITEVPRPYTHELAALKLVDSAPDFYQLTTEQKEVVIEHAKVNVSEWRIQHWEGETNYSLPSGHTIFVAVCIVFWGGFLLRNKRYIPIAILLGWGLGVAMSRIWLGMHWPSDLIASTCCAALLYLLVPEPTE